VVLGGLRIYLANFCAAGDVRLMIPCLVLSLPALLGVRSKVRGALRGDIYFVGASLADISRRNPPANKTHLSPGGPRLNLFLTRAAGRPAGALINY
jgi:hypothetical protein